MAEAAVHTLLDVEVVKRVDKVGPIEVSVDSEHLPEDSLTDLDKVRWEATALTDPVARARELREGCGKGSRTSRDRGVRTWCVEAAGGVGCA